MDSIAVTKRDMTVVRQGTSGLSPFGMLSRLFQEELEQRVQFGTGAWSPVPMTLLEEPEEGAAPPVNLALRVDVHVDAPAPAPARAEAPPAPGPAERIVERVRLRERELRESREVIHRLTLRLEKAAGGLAAAPSGGRNGIAAAARDVGAALALASQAAAVPSAGGWLPEVRPQHPGYPPSERPETPSGRSILLPDVLRRRRAEALEAELGGVCQTGAADPSAALLQQVRRAVTETLAHRLREEPAAQAAPTAAAQADRGRAAALPHRPRDGAETETSDRPAAPAAVHPAPSGASAPAVEPLAYRETAAETAALPHRPRDGAETETSDRPAAPVIAHPAPSGVSAPAAEPLAHREETAAERAASTDRPRDGAETDEAFDRPAALSATRPASDMAPASAAEPAVPADGPREAGETEASIRPAPPSARPAVTDAAAPAAEPLTHREGAAAETAVPADGLQEAGETEASIRHVPPSARPAITDAAAPAAEPLTHREGTAAESAVPTGWLRDGAETETSDHPAASTAARPASATAPASAAEPADGLQETFESGVSTRPAPPPARRAVTDAAAPAAEPLTYREGAVTEPAAPTGWLRDGAETETSDHPAASTAARPASATAPASTAEPADGLQETFESGVSTRPAPPPARPAVTDAAAPAAEPLTYREDTAAEPAAPADRPREAIKTESSARSARSSVRPVTTDASAPAAEPLTYREETTPEPAESRRAAPDRAAEAAASGRRAASAARPAVSGPVAPRAAALNHRAVEAADSGTSGPAPAAAAARNAPADGVHRAAQATARPVPSGTVPSTGAPLVYRDADAGAEDHPLPETAARPEGVSRDIRLVRPSAGQSAVSAMAFRASQPPLILSRGPAEARQPTPQPPAPAEEPAADALPAWARALLEKPGAAAGKPPRTIQWTAPGAVRAAESPPPQPPRAANAVPPPMQLREHGTAVDDPQRRMEREAELRRAADRIYRIIEERLRRELRRSGR